MKLVVAGSFHHELDIVGAVVRDVMTNSIAVATPDMDLFAVEQLLDARVRRLQPDERQPNGNLKTMSPE
jgi:hypothetical protein